MSTLVDALRAHWETRPDQPAIHLLRAKRPDVALTYRDLICAAAGVAARLAAAGISRGDVVAIILQHGEPLVAAFWGAVLHGAVPSILPFLTEKLSPEKYRQDLAALFAITRPAAILTYTEFGEEARRAIAEAPLDAEKPVVIDLDTVEPIAPDWAALGGSAVRADDIALLQHSSGSTGLQKGVALSHLAIFNQLESYGQSIRLAPATDVIASWLPLYHDMGLIASFVLPVALGVPLVLLSPFDWVRAPARLLQAISIYRATLCWLPNFAYNFTATRVRDRDLEGLDLSSMRAFVNCSEPMRAASHRMFAARFASIGVREPMLTTCYAMAENVFAVTQGGIDAPVVVDCPVARDLREERHARLPAPDEAVDTVEMMSAGRPIGGVQLRIVDEANSPVGERQIGEICLRSSSMLTGYYHRDDATAMSIREGWFFTGDYGYLADGELYVTGRKKDLIIVGGKNVYPQDIELLVEEVEGIRAGRVVAFGVFDEAAGTEEIAVVAEAEPAEEEALTQVREDIRRRIAQRSDVVARIIELVPPRWLIKTSSGKVARTANKEKYLAMASASPQEPSPT
jgi:acyl-CoA synthetase (AMP-forming)/AMP-acid ligase II